jgi:2-methylcitrate dehydratase PrpD
VASTTSAAAVREPRAAADSGSAGRDSGELIAEHLARVRYDDLPATAVAAARRSIADTLACIIAGTGGEEHAAVVAQVRQWSGAPASTVIGTGGLQVSPDYAVLANGAAVHQYDFDDTHDRAVCHPTPATFMPAFALAQERGGVSGRDLLTAVAAGNDLVSRIALAINGRLNSYAWIRASIAGIFGAAAASAKVLGATAAQHYDALGLALPQAAGTLASLHNPGSSVRSIRDGLCYRSAVLAAALAMRGVRGDREVFDGRYGVYQTYFRGEYDRGVLTGELGRRYETDRISLKPWPSCRHLHATLTAVLRGMQAHGLRFDDVDHVVLHVGDINLDRCRPVRTGMVPVQRIDLLCNLPFAVGAALRHGGLPLRLYRDGAMADDVITQAVPKVRWQFDERQNGRWTLEPGLVDIATRDGRTLTVEAKIAHGHPDDPMTTDERRQKMVACCAAAARPVGDAQALRLFDAVESLDRMSDVRQLAELLP